MSWVFWTILVYLCGAAFTFLFNMVAIVGPVMYPTAIIRNMVFWPVCLPLLIWIKMQDD